MRRSLRHLVLTTALALGASGLAAAVPAHATGSPPVTKPDSVRMTGMFASDFVDVLRNDSDPDGDELAICRLGRIPRQLYVETSSGEDGGAATELFVSAKRPGVSGTFTFTYYACDFDYLVPGTVTVTIDRGPDVKVHRLGSRPGRLKAVNPARFPIIVMYGARNEDDPDGRVRVARLDSKVFAVRRHRIFWIAVRARTFDLVDYGEVKGIRLPRGGAQERSAPSTGKQLDAWRDAVRRLG